MKVRILEVVAKGDSAPMPTGREILMEDDSPLFVAFGEKGKLAVQTGSLAILPPLFEEIKKIVEEANAAEDEVPKARTDG